MSWNLYQWIWKLESPLFVGMPPAGSLNRCRLNTNKDVFPEYYKQKQKDINNTCRFTNGKKLTERKFRQLLLDSRPGTAIDPNTDSAAESSLRETECINQWWKDPTEPQKKYRPVVFHGYVFIKENTSLDTKNPIIHSKHIYAHGKAQEMVGARELLVGWDCGNLKSGKKTPFWLPGSVVSKSSNNSDPSKVPEWEINQNGIWAQEMEVCG